LGESRPLASSSNAKASASRAKLHKRRCGTELEAREAARQILPEMREPGAKLFAAPQANCWCWSTRDSSATYPRQRRFRRARYMGKRLVGQCGNAVRGHQADGQPRASSRWKITCRGSPARVPAELGQIESRKRAARNVQATLRSKARVMRDSSIRQTSDPTNDEATRHDAMNAIAPDAPVSPVYCHANHIAPTTKGCSR
jgi:hypothetical protein